ncbi:hypothetical protein EGW08_017748 [Elysia chlorotica]|uniref:C2H2-type domain-containing protein n=1 Tax=Elysia chlorotica TaxID=188477 RepID=A0A3S1BTJ1_ELYCH|nr:hypothetical protein EGW08_017748 [Elysia chlorotica]
MKRASLSCKDKGQGTKRTTPLRGNDQAAPIRTAKHASQGSDQTAAMKTEKLSFRGSEQTTTPETGKLASKQQSSNKSYSTRRASSLSARGGTALRSHSASPAASRALLKRSQLSSPKGRESPDTKCPKVGPVSRRPRGRPSGQGLRRGTPTSPREIERRRMAEMKKLTTTDGFWAGSSPAGEGESSQVKRRASNSKRSSANTTPDVSPVSTTRKKSVSTTTASQTKSVKPDKEQSVGNSVTELRRLQTTDGFWSPSSILSDSRDASPSSTSSSLDRSFRQRSQQNKNIGHVANPRASESQTLASKNTQKVRPQYKSKILMRRSSAPDIVAPEKEGSRQGRSRASRAHFLSNSLKKKSILQRSPTRFGKQTLPYLRGRAGRFVSPSTEAKGAGSQSLELSMSSEPEELKKNLRRRKGEEDMFGKSEEDVRNVPALRKRQTLTSPVMLKAKPDGLKNKKPHVNNCKDESKEDDTEKEHIRRTALAKMTPNLNSKRKSRIKEAGQRKTMLQTRIKGASEETQSKSDGKEKDATAKAGNESNNPSGLEQVPPSTPSLVSSRLAISDLLGSGELRRLDTTPGFWAPTPDVSHVLARRSSGSSPRPSRRAATYKAGLSPQKPKSNLLQLRKKKLSVLQKQRQIKKQISKEEQAQAEPIHRHNVGAEASKKDKFGLGRRRRKYTKKSLRLEDEQLHNSGSLDYGANELMNATEEFVTEGVSDDFDMQLDVKATSILLSDPKAVSNPTKDFQNVFESTVNGPNTFKPVHSTLEFVEIATQTQNGGRIVDKIPSKLKTNISTVTYERSCDKADKLISPAFNKSSLDDKLEPDVQESETQPATSAATMTDKVELASVKPGLNSASTLGNKFKDKSELDSVSKDSAVLVEVKSNDEKNTGSKLHASTVKDKMEADLVSRASVSSDNFEPVEDRSDVKLVALKGKSKDELVTVDVKEIGSPQFDVEKMYSPNAVEESSSTTNNIEASKCEEKQMVSDQAQHESKEVRDKRITANVSSSEKEIDEPDSVSAFDLEDDKTDSRSSIVKDSNANLAMKEADSYMALEDRFSSLSSEGAESSIVKEDSNANIQSTETDVSMEVLDSSTVALELGDEKKGSDSASNYDLKEAHCVADEVKPQLDDSLTKGAETKMEGAIYKVAPESVNKEEFEQKRIDCATSNGGDPTQMSEAISGEVSETEIKQTDGDPKKGVELKAPLSDPMEGAEKQPVDSTSEEHFVAKAPDSSATEVLTKLTHSSINGESKLVEPVSNCGVDEKPGYNEMDAAHSSLVCPSNETEIAETSREEILSADVGNSKSLIAKDDVMTPTSSNSSVGVVKDLKPDKMGTKPVSLATEYFDNVKTVQGDENIQVITCPMKLDSDNSLTDNNSIASKSGNDATTNPCSSSVLSVAPNSTAHPEKSLGTDSDSATFPENLGSQSGTTKATILKAESVLVKPVSTGPAGDASKSNILHEEVQLVQPFSTSSGAYPKTKQDPLRKVVKRKRNAWKRGILHKGTKMYRKSVQNSQRIPYPSLQKSALQKDPSFSDGEIASLPDQSLVADSQTLTNTVRDAKKSAKELRKSIILRRLQTDANLAGGVLDDSTLHSGGRSLREIAPKNKDIPTLRKELASDVNVIDLTSKPKIRSGKGPGRPRKNKEPDNLPKLVLSSKPEEDSNVLMRWYKTPPKLSPQPIGRLEASSGSPGKHGLTNQDTEFVTENVDDSDLHLYLSGISEEESSPVKSGDLSDLSLAYNPINLAGTLASLSNGSSNAITVTPKKVGGLKLKGRKGKPPGTPMTEEEKMKIKSNLIARYGDSASFKKSRTARKSTYTPSLYLASAGPPSTVKKFSLRQKTTRSPLEMLEMKRKQEEAIYDREQEKRLAKRINRMEKRFSQASADDLYEDCDDSEWGIRDCAVVLNDFVKKLHLESIDISPVAEHRTAQSKRPESPENIPSDLEEDWCANLEDFQDECGEGWTNDGNHPEKRPFIPRLKLKRIPKVEKEKKVKVHKSKKRPRFILPKPDALQPLKVVIKTEASSFANQDSAAKSASAVDVANIHRPGFEGSFVDFLKGKTTDEFMKPKEKRFISKSAAGGVNDGRLILNLGSVGGLKSKKSVATSGPTVNSNQTHVANDDMGAMMSSYFTQENQDGTTNNARNGQEGDGKSGPGLEVNPAPPSEVCSTATASTKSTCEKSAESPLLNTTTTTSKTNNNNNIEILPQVTSLQAAQQAKVSPVSKTVSPVKDGLEPGLKRSTPCPCPEGWKVKTIQPPEKQPSGRRFTCKRCPFGTSSHLTIESHIYSHIPGVQFRCAYCESEFSSMAATASHIKNTHKFGEACLHISRSVEEQNFYDAEDSSARSGVAEPDQAQTAAGERVVRSPRGGTTQVAGSVVVASGDGAGQGGQSPPVVISVLVSSGAAATASGANHGAGIMVRPGNVAPCSSTPPSATNKRRYVCTHCGFSTNVRADAEHHVLDLHPSSSIFACSLCKENMYYSDAEIKQHAATVHPSRSRPFCRLPDFYDAEKLSSAALSCEDIVIEMSGSVYPEGHAADESSPVDHRQRAKDYLQLQEGLKEKRSAEADSTTAADYMECEEEPSDPCVSSQAEAEADSVSKGGDKPSSQDTEVAASVAAHSSNDVSISNHSLISSSAECSSGPGKDASAGGAEEMFDPKASKSVDCPESHAEAAVSINKDADEDGSSGSSGLKIVEVVSLSSQGESAGYVQELSSGDGNSSSQPQNSSEKNSGDPTGEDVPLSSLAPGSVPAASTDVTNAAAIPAVTTAHKAPAQPGSATTNQPAGGLPLSYKCSACRVHTPYLLMMVKHLKAKHPHMGCFSCPYCKMSALPQSGPSSSVGQAESFVTQKQLRSHIRKLHPEKTGRNEIALSARAKQFVEAMVLPAGPECIRVGSRLVLEEDIHTCTYCNLKMTSLASVYEHLNELHADLFEFVCPICQNFKSKNLEAISVHSLEVHFSEVETDKVHVSVPKNLFSVLKCISKGGKYIEKHLDGTSSNTESNSSSKNPNPATPVVNTGSTPSSVKAAPPAKSCVEPDNCSAPLDLTSASQSITRVPAPAHTPAAIAPPIIQAPPAHTGKPAGVSFSSSLFDTSSLSAPPLLVVSPVAGGSSAAASSFLSPQHKSPTPGRNLQSTLASPAMASVGKHKHAKSSPSPAPKSLPVLNVPTIKPRPPPASSAGARQRVLGIAEPQPETAITGSRTPVISHTSSVKSSSSSYSATQSPQSAHLSLPTSATSFDDLPDDEPNPDAFKIFNLQPTPPLVNSPAPVSVLHSPSPVTLTGQPSPSAIPTVFPPVSSPLSASFIQGPIVGFPPGLVISQALLPPHPSTFSQQQQAAMFRSATPAGTVLSSSPGGSGMSSKQRASPGTFSQPQRPKSASVASADTQLLKEKQKRELLLLKQQYQQQRQGAGFEGFPKDPSQLAEEDRQQAQKKQQKQLRMQQLQFLQQVRQQQQLAHRQQMLQRAVLNQQQQQQQANNLAQQVQAQMQSYPSFQVPAAQAWFQQQRQQQQRNQLMQQQQEMLRQKAADFANAGQAAQMNHPQATSSTSSPAPPPTSSSAPTSSSGMVSPRSSKGVHKRSSSLYQCPYCPAPVVLKALDVASHIHQKHPGSQVVFKKAAS